ncbi:MAG: hypothetical protein EOP48_33885 [Sphingobacteriales bacterium]|nr:MAG: hypothetical protein EOP48_33885 [Sphingobacteriales bacterium]
MTLNLPKEAMYLCWNVLLAILQYNCIQNIYVYLLQKREETALSLAATASVARVLDLAKGGDYPISPNKQIIYLMAVLLGLGVPFAGIFLSSLLNNKIQSQTSS